MNITLDKDGKVSEELVWLAAWTTVAGANDCKSPDVATNWADNCVLDFRKRFVNFTHKIEPKEKK